MELQAALDEQTGGEVRVTLGTIWLDQGDRATGEPARWFQIVDQEQAQGVAWHLQQGGSRYREATEREYTNWGMSKPGGSRMGQGL